MLVLYENEDKKIRKTTIMTMKIIMIIEILLGPQ